MRLLGSAPKSHLCDQRRRSKVTGLSDLMTLFIHLGCLYCKQTQRAFNVFKNTLNWLKIDSVDQKFNWLECGNFSHDAGMPGTERVIVFSQLAVKGLKTILIKFGKHFYRMCGWEEKVRNGVSALFCVQVTYWSTHHFIITRHHSVLKELVQPLPILLQQNSQYHNTLSVSCKIK
jgi:hypothetical protein